MDMLTLAMAKAYTDSQRLAYEETKVTKLADFVVPAGQGGGTDPYRGMTIDAPFNFGDTNTLAWKDNTPYFVTVNGKTFEVDASIGGESGFTLSNEYFGINQSIICSSTWQVSVNDPNGLTDTVDRHIVIETREAVTHTIEPKFLPGVCLPVFDIGNLDDISHDFTPEENALMDAIAATEMPFIFKGSVDDGKFCCVMNFNQYYSDKEYKSMASGNFHTNIKINRGSNGWCCFCCISPNV